MPGSSPWTKKVLSHPRTFPLHARLASLLIVWFVAGCGRVAPPPPCKILGIDVSRHQGVIDWGQVAGAGVAFTWVKATEGGDYLDPTFARNWAAAHAAGIKRGAYHFVYWCRPAQDQAAWFIANVPNDTDALPPVLDVEWNPGSRSCPAKVAREKARAEIDIMLSAMRRAYGRRPILYAPADFFADVFDSVPDNTMFWARDLATAPTYGGSAWHIWQYSETGRVPGIDGAVDLDCVSSAAALGIQP